MQTLFLSSYYAFPFNAYEEPVLLAVIIARNVVQNAVTADLAVLNGNIATKQLWLLTFLPICMLSTLHGKKSSKTTTTMEPDVILRHICSFCTATPLEIMLKLQF